MRPAAWYEKLLAVNPQEKEAWYNLGVIDWAKWHPRLLEVLQESGMKPEDMGPIPNDKLRQDLRSTSLQFVEEGVANLQRALLIDSTYPEAMDYMAILVRERASLDDTPEQYEKDIASANDWAQKAAEAKKARASHPQRVRVGGNVQAANLIRKVIPRYPPDAKQAGIQGTVRFQMILGTDGKVQSLQLVSGDPALVAAARDAVEQWVYKPTLLNGQPVEVVTTVDVNFVLGKPHM